MKKKNKKERDPDRLWLDDGACYIEFRDGGYLVVHDDEQLAVYRGPEVLLQTALLKLGDRTEAGMLVTGVSVTWVQIAKELDRNPNFLSFFSRMPRKFEEFVAGAYRESDWHEVTLTPPSGDKGRDVIATSAGSCSIRLLDQAKAYRPGRLVKHNDVRAMLGVLTTDSNTSKGRITTTSNFEPRILAGDEFARFMPYRLELRNGQELLKWVKRIRQDGKGRKTRGAKVPCR